jgi:hypothetical protein
MSLLNDVDHQLKALQNSGLPTSPFAWLDGAHLAQIFENFLKRPAGISRHRKKHNPRGPYLRFVKSVLGALSETNNYRGTHSDETIVRAFTTNKSLSTAAKAAAAASAQRELDRFYSRKADLYANCC